MTKEFEHDKMFLYALTARCIANAYKSTCSRMHFGSVIFKDGKVISDGYNYPVLGECTDSCIREELDIHHGTHLETCWAIHAEQSALLKAGKDAKGAYLMVVGVKPNGEFLWRKNSPFYCSVCARLIMGSGVHKIIGITEEGYKFMTPEEAMRYSMEISTGKKVFKA